MQTSKFKHKEENTKEKIKHHEMKIKYNLKYKYKKTFKLNLRA